MDHHLPSPSGDHHHRAPRKTPLSYSQPLAPRRRTPMRSNHSLDESSDDPAFRALYHHSSSLPEEALRRHRHAGGPHLFPPPPLSLERIMSSSDSPHSPAASPGSHSLPEFVGAGGGQGIFRVPLRGAVHLGRPPSVEVRPHPYRETQVGCFLRTVGCCGDQLWAGLESGVRVWSLKEAFKGREERITVVRVTRGDEETAPFVESCRTSPALCLVVDSGNRLVWSGHKDGKIRSWKMDQTMVQEARVSLEGDGGSGNAAAATAAGGNGGFKEGLSWQAHRGPVLSMTFTSHGDLWSGSEGGIIKAWSWEAIEKSLSLKTEERHMAALLVERSFVDLRNLVTVGGACPLPSADIRFLISDNSKAKVWSGTSLSFSLWNSRTKELLKVFNIDGHIENKVENLSANEAYVEDEMKAKFVSSSKKEKSQGSVSFFQRSRNALMGAADAVRRVAVKGAFGDDNRRMEAMAISTDGMIWTGCANGLLVQWDGSANRLQEFQYHASAVQSLCAFGTRLWVGYASGNIQILDLEGNILGGWTAHSSSVIKMVVGGGYIFTLANHGGLRGWSLTSPGPIDEILRSEITSKEHLYTTFENFKILAGTWNVGQERASPDSLKSWIGSAAPEADVVIIGLQEVEMGAGFLAMAAAKETVGLEGSANGQWWLDNIGKALDEGAIFDRVGSRQLAGLLISVWARKHLKKHIGDIDAAAVACGFGRAIGNKGGVGLRMRIYGRIICFANCHFAAHLEAINKRNADFDHIFRTMSFSRPSVGPPSSGAGSTSVQVARGSNIKTTPAGLPPDDNTPELSEADLIMFLGDFNYRLHGISYDEARDFVSQRCFDWLREKDQLREEMKNGKVFQGMREGLIRFPPTYKFDRHKVGLSGYDSGEKKRIPAWCDRILYRDNRSISLQECSLECPVVCSILKYDACMDVTDSDHKPVRCLINADVARVDKMVRRQEFGEILLSNQKIRSFLEENSGVPETSVSTNDITLQNQDTFILRVTNKSNKEKAAIEISCEGQSSKENGVASEPHPRGGSGFPRGLEVTPTLGILKPGQTMEVTIHHEEFHTLEEFVDGIPQNWLSEDTKDKHVILAVNVVGTASTKSTTHHIQVNHSFSTKAGRADSRGSSRRVQPNHLHKADLRQFSGS